MTIHFELWTAFIFKLETVNWKTLLQMFNYIKSTKGDIAHMRTDGTQTIKWYIDSSFAVHKGIKRHTSATMTLGYRIIISKFTKQKTIQEVQWKAKGLQSTIQFLNTLDYKIY